MKDIGYYAGFLRTEAQERINSAHLYELVVSLYGLADEFVETYYAWDDTTPDETSSLLNGEGMRNVGDRDKIALIRGLCDRIELKLMEAAK